MQSDTIDLSFYSICIARWTVNRSVYATHDPMLIVFCGQYIGRHFPSTDEIILFMWKECSQPAGPAIKLRTQLLRRQMLAKPEVAVAPTGNTSFRAYSPDDRLPAASLSALRSSLAASESLAMSWPPPTPQNSDECSPGEPPVVAVTSSVEAGDVTGPAPLWRLFGSRCSRFHFIRRFWNQILIWRSVSPSACAISTRRRPVRYRLKWNSFSSSSVW